MIRRSTLIAVEILLGLVAALVIGLGVAWWRLSQGPVELSYLRETVQAELSAARSGRPVGIERVELAWTPDNALQLRAVGVTVEDGAGAVLSRADEARIELSVLPLLIGRVSVEEAEFIGGQITLTRKINGVTHIAFGPENAPPDIILDAPERNETLEQRVARTLDGMEAAFRPVGAGGGLRAIRASGAQFAYIDEQSGARWNADAANFELARDGRSLELKADARLEGPQGLAPATLRVVTDTRFQAATVQFGAQNVRPRALFSQAALGPFGALDAPMTATVSIGLDRQNGVTRFEGDAQIGRGVAEMPGGRFDLTGGRVHGRYDVESDVLIIDQLAIGGARTSVRGEVRVADVSRIMRAAPNEPAAFNVALPALSLDIPGTFAQPVSLENVQAVGTIVSADRSIQFTRLHAETGDGVLEASGRVYWAEAGAERRLHAGIQLNGAVTGAVDARTVVAFWPMGLGESAREYLARSIIGGRVTDGRVMLDIRPSDFAAGAFRNEAIDIRFNVSNAEMRYVTTMSPVVAARGSGILRGNSFEMTIPEARLNNLVVRDGRVELPRLKPKGAMATISARVEGDARNLVELLMQEPIGLRERLPIDAASVTGRGAVNVRIQRPMLADVPFEEWRFTVDGRITNFAGNMTTRRMALTNGQLTVRGDQRAITVAGPVRAGTSEIEQIRWTEHIGRRGAAADAGSSEYQIMGTFAADDLERLGYTVARYAQGRVGVTVTGQGRGFDINNARIDLDLTAAEIEAPRQFWVKRAGQAASARFNVGRNAEGGMVFTNLDVRGAGLSAQGRVVLTRDSEIQEAEITRLVMEGRSDARLNARRAADGGMDVVVRGAMFDAAPFMGSDTARGSRTQPAAAGAPATPPPPPLRADVQVERLKMRGGATLNNARVSLTTSRGALATLMAEGNSPSGRPFSLALGPRPSDPAGRIRFRSDDAGFAVAALTGSENVVGGTVTADGDWRTGPPSQARFNVHMRDFEVVRLPAMARLLSSAGSLTGMVEMLNGDGIGFSALDAQMSYANDQLVFTEGRMAGPSLGLTGAGSYNIARDNLDVDGVVAPSPGLNLSMLGEIPVIGDLLVSRRGEGVFGMTYSINGRAAEPRVGVNPVSALTPGILRRIFEPVQRPAGGAHSWVQPQEAEGDAAEAESPAPVPQVAVNEPAEASAP